MVQFVTVELHSFPGFFSISFVAFHGEVLLAHHPLLMYLHQDGDLRAIVAERAALVQSNMAATAPEVIVIE